MIKKEKLKPCPFCGNKRAPIILRKDLGVEGTEGLHYVTCSATCGGCGASSSYGRSEEKAIEKWNTRVGS